MNPISLTVIQCLQRLTHAICILLNHIIHQVNIKRKQLRRQYLFITSVAHVFLILLIFTRVQVMEEFPFKTDREEFQTFGDHHHYNQDGSNENQ